jgi:hypothetical protein
LDEYVSREAEGSDAISNSRFSGYLKLGFGGAHTESNQRLYVHLGVGFTAAVTRSGRVGDLRIPSVHGKLGIPTSNHEPVDRIRGHKSTDFTSEFLLC